MKHRPALVLAAVALLLAASSAVPAADTPGAVGTWDAVATTPNGDLPSVITVRLTGGRIDADIEIAGETYPVTDETFEGNVLRMKVDYQGATYDVEAKVDGDAMEGTWQGNGASGTLKAKRRP
jgi:opacity protein-like surface antigen